MHEGLLAQASQHALSVSVVMMVIWLADEMAMMPSQLILKVLPLAAVYLPFQASQSEVGAGGDDAEVSVETDVVEVDTFTVVPAMLLKGTDCEDTGDDAERVVTPELGIDEFSFVVFVVLVAEWDEFGADDLFNECVVTKVECKVERTVLCVIGCVALYVVVVVAVEYGLGGLPPYPTFDPAAVSMLPKLASSKVTTKDDFMTTILIVSSRKPQRRSIEQ